MEKYEKLQRNNVSEEMELSFGKGYVNLKYKGMNHGRVTLSGTFTPWEIKKAIEYLVIRVGQERRTRFRSERRSGK
ncbi:MAG: hypothetical protein V1660_02050 [archaeon]